MDEPETIERDAERYRWLRECVRTKAGRLRAQALWWEFESRKQLDKAIDAAMREAVCAEPLAEAPEPSKQKTPASSIQAESPSADRGPLRTQLQDALERYWACAYVEGQEGRDYDTPDGLAQQTLSELLRLFDAAVEGGAKP